MSHAGLRPVTSEFWRHGLVIIRLVTSRKQEKEKERVLRIVRKPREVDGTRFDGWRKPRLEKIAYI